MDEADMALHRVLRLQPPIGIGLPLFLLSLSKSLPSEIGSGVNPCTDDLQTVLFIFGGCFINTQLQKLSKRENGL